jgi:hypothetical protein
MAALAVIGIERRMDAAARVRAVEGVRVAALALEQRR